MRARDPGRIASRSIGTGRPVVLVMGLGGTMDAWDPAFVDGLAATGHRVVVFDNEGAGRSELRPGTLTIRRMGQNVDRLVRALRLERREGAVPTPPPAVANAQVAAATDWLGGADADGKRVARLRVPTLVAGGELDPLLPAANQRHLAKTMR